MTRWCTSFRWRLVVVRVVFMVSFLPYPGRSDPQTNLLYQACSQVNATNLQSFFNNLNDTLIEIRKQLSNNNTYFATSDVSRYSQPVYVMAMCRKYMSTADCVSCFDFAASSIRSCGAFNGAQSVLDGCFLRYESSCFYDQITLPYNQGGICGNGTLSRQNLFEIAVDGLLSNLSIATPKINGFYAAAKAPVEYYPNTTAYAIAQCAITLTPDRCKRCLQVAYANIMICASEVIEARAVDDPGCFMRFSGAAFFLDYQTTNITPFLQNETSSNKGAIIGGVVGGVCSLIILLIVVFLWYDRLKRIPPGDNLYWAIELPRPKDYSYSDLKKATKDFSDECKLGEGGFGDVYKGIVDDKEVVAVKKLKVRNKRAKVGFENEILLVSNIRHRNLLRLLGCSSDGSNLLLVLEYMSNGSLDKFLWGEKRGALSWERRFDIIVGVARGLAHIHKEFHVSIVHRDIKSSNILLDDQFQPKIADFGLARFHPEDQSHVTTKFAGTLHGSCMKINNL